jgi:GrpB-like predicted nucleotidyltransferase (UPF0157 family)
MTERLSPTTFDLVAYDPRWARRGAELVDDIRKRIGPGALRVEHIGSTAIPGMAAKPTFDLRVSVAALGPCAGIIDAALAPLGLVRRPWEQDHVPAGIDDDPRRWSKRLWGKAEPGGERILVHARVAGSPNERLALLFRDWFIAHPAMVPSYSRFKLALAAAVDDLDVYTDVKDPVVDLVVQVAEAWAADTGWSVG